MFIFPDNVSKRFVLGVILFFLCTGLALGAILLGPAFFASFGAATDKGGGTTVQSATTAKIPVSGNAIVQENAQLGTANWQIAPGRAATTQIQAYADARSVLPGKKIVFFVSTKQEGTNYWFDVYRIDWYGGLGGRLMTSIGTLTGHAQGYYDVTAHHLVSCNTCLINN